MVKGEYKDTEIGVLPEDWELIDFKDCFDLLPNNTFSRAELNYDSGEVRNIHYGDILMKFPAILDCTDTGLPFINSSNNIKNSRSYLKNGDIIIADTAEDETVGKAVELFGIQNQKIVSGLHTIPCRPKVSFEAKWLGYLINHRIYHDQLLPYITGTKVSAISKSAIKETKIIKPLLKEQKAIATALSDIDELIVNLENLIVKKKAIKQGAMQELLARKKRISGFSGEWKTVKLGDVVDVFNGDRGANYPSGDDFVKYGIPFINAGHLQNGYVNLSEMDYISFEHYNRLNGVKIQSGDLLFCLRGSLGKYALVSFDNAAPASSLCVIRCKSFISNNYLFQLLGSEMIKKQIINTNTGSSQPNLSAENIRCFNVLLPVDIKEQEIIANILSDMDAGVEQLYEQLNKYLQIKGGMMSELLTGKIRLV